MTVPGSVDEGENKLQKPDTNVFERLRLFACDIHPAPTDLYCPDKRFLVLPFFVADMKALQRSGNQQIFEPIVTINKAVELMGR